MHTVFTYFLWRCFYYAHIIHIFSYTWVDYAYDYAILYVLMLLYAYNMVSNYNTLISHSTHKESIGLAVTTNRFYDTYSCRYFR